MEEILNNLSKEEEIRILDSLTQISQRDRDLYFEHKYLDKSIHQIAIEQKLSYTRVKALLLRVSDTLQIYRTDEGLSALLDLHLKNRVYNLLKRKCLTNVEKATKFLLSGDFLNQSCFGPMAFENLRECLIEYYIGTKDVDKVDKLRRLKYE